MLDPVVSKIIEALKEDDMPAHAIGALVGCSQSFVAQVKNGKRNPGTFTLAFCRVLGVNPGSGSTQELTSAPKFTNPTTTPAERVSQARRILRSADLDISIVQAIEFLLDGKIFLAIERIARFGQNTKHK